MSKKICPSCQSTDIIPNADIVGSDDLAIRIYEKPDVTLRGMRHHPIKAWVCTQCGYTQLYVSQPRELHKSYLRYAGQE